MSHKISSRFQIIVLAGILALYGCEGDMTQITSTTQHGIPEDPSEISRISPAEVKKRLDAGERILIVDVRESADFETQHIVGAISVPLWQLITRIDEFPHDRQIVFY